MNMPATQRCLVTAVESAYVLQRQAFPLDFALHHLLQRQCELTPDATAIIFGGGKLSYAELNQQANRLAKDLIEKELACQSLVAICLDRSPQMVVAMLAVLKAGLAYVPIDPLYPSDRIDFMVSDTNAALIITSDSYGHMFANCCPSVMLFNSLFEQAECAQQYDPEIPVTGEHLAVIIYTSGSTGKPKGVMIEHEAYINRLFWRQHIHPLGPGDRFLQMTSFSFGPSVAEIFIPLICGATCVLMEPLGNKQGDEIAKTILQHQVNATIMVPSLLATLLKSGSLAQCRDCLKYVYCGGESMPPETVAAFEQQLPNTGLHEVYGQTETVLTHHWDHTTQEQNISFGHSLPNKTIYILDENRQPVKVGQIGEIYSAGIGVARGYLNRPELTEQKFIADPFTKDSHYRIMYATGDLAMFTEDGAIKLAGRSDDQVKLRGLRIEIPEIESVAYGHPDIELAVAKVVNDGIQGDQLVLYYTKVAKKTEVNADELVDYLGRFLPRFMLPQRFVCLEEFKLLPNGKVDRKQLPLPPRQRPNLSYGFVEPSSFEEYRLAEIFKSVLALDKVGVLDSFFDLGGDSLALVNVVRLCKEQGITLSFEQFYQGPSIAQLIKSMSEARSSGLQAMTLTQLKQEVEILFERLDLEYDSTNQNASQQQVLLTGASGFVGTHLLFQLLSTTDAQVFCLVRSDSESLCEERLYKQMSQWQLDVGAFKSRVTVIKGDLSKPYFDLAMERYNRLANSIDCIYHNGAWVNHVYPYSVLKAVNVDSTLAIIKFAALAKRKQIRYMSTTALAAQAAGIHPFRTGYTETKYVSEQLLLKAKGQGLAVTCFRLGMVCGNSQTGCANTNDIVALFIKACVQLRCIPEPEEIVQFMPAKLLPVNVLVADIVGFDYDLKKSLVEVDNPLPVDWSKLIRALNRLGYCLKSVSFDNWQQKVSDMANQSPQSFFSAVESAIVQRRAFYHAEKLNTCNDEIYPIGRFYDMDDPVMTRLVGFYQQHLF